MPNKIKPKRSYTTNSVPLTTDLEAHELAINWADGVAYTKNASGQIVSVPLGGSGGSSSSEDTALRAYFLPTAPTNVTATAGNGQASVTWAASTTIAQIPVTDYVIQYSSNSGSTWTTFSDGTSTSTSATVTGLTNGTAYTFRVAGVNGVGTGAYSTASSAVTPVTGDPYFANVSLLLHMDGSGSTFVDSSGSPKTITANGGVTQSTTQSKFGGKSAAFAGSSSNYLSVPYSSGFDMGAGDFVVEMWLFLNSISSQVSLFSAVADGGMSIEFQDASTIGILRQATEWRSTAPISPPIGSWFHLAVSRSSGVVRFYLNGSQIGSDQSDSYSYTMIGNGATIGRNGKYGTAGAIDGYLDDVRITKGTARGYTGATIAVPTAPYPDSAPPFGGPASITGLSAWFDASDASTLYDATSGGSLVAADGSVARWEDKSGNGRHATQSTSANRPLRKTASINSLDALLFDGSDDGFSFSGNIENGSGYVSLFVVARKTSTSGVGFLVNKDNSQVSPRAHQFLRINGTNVETHWWTPTLQAPTRGTVSANTTFLASLRLGSDNGVVGLNGVEGTVDSDVSGITTTNQPTQIGIYSLNNDNPWGGHICEIVAYDNKISDTDADAVEAYLMTKWGIA